MKFKIKSCKTVFLLIAHIVFNNTLFGCGCGNKYTSKTYEPSLVPKDKKANKTFKDEYTKIWKNDKTGEGKGKHKKYKMNPWVNEDEYLTSRLGATRKINAANYDYEYEKDMAKLRRELIEYFRLRDLENSDSNKVDA